MWTNNQLEAISAPNTGLIVSAAAGSGKTAVLVERLCRQICSNIPVQKMIVVTFTDDAANQLKNRLSQVLRERITKEPENEWLIRQQNMLGSAKISTISSFCFNIIRENINRLSVAPNFRIIESVEENVLLKKAASETIETFYSTNMQDIKILDEYFCKNFEAKSIDFLLDLHRFLTSLPFREKYLEQACEKFRDISENCDIIADEYSGFIKEKLSEIISRYKSLSTLCVGEFAVYYDYFETIISDLSHICNKADKNNIFEATEQIRNFTIKSIPRLSVDKNLEEQKVFINTLKDEIRGELKTLGKISLTREQMQSDCKMQHTLLSCIKRLYYAFSERFEKIKSEKNVLTFSDGEALALKLLYDENAPDGKSDIAVGLSEYYEIIACDEYQDVNNVQEMIFSLISKNRTNIFAVGDIKQSIYRFRQANPNIFLDTLDSAVDFTGIKQDFMQRITLARNFRSSQETVDFVNMVFSKLMSKECGDVDYCDNHALVCGAEYDKSDRSAEIMLVEADNAENEKLCQPDAVALKIKSMLDSGAMVTMKNGEKRRCTYSDFCILMRTKNRFSEYKGALEKLGIKVSSMTKEGYLSSREIALLCDILRIIDNPSRDISIAAVALSPIFAFSPDELSAIRLENMEISLYGAFVLSQNSENISELTKAKCTDFIGTIEKLRIFSACSSISELIRKIYITTDLISVMQLYSDGEKKSANLRLMLSYAEGYEVSSSNGLSGFLRYLEAIEDKKSDLSVAQTVSGSDDSVSITTIHASKGLEYPFVFLCDNRRAFNNKDLSSDILMHKSYGIGAKYISKISLKSFETYAHSKIRHELLKESQSESMRLLYVALTRAREKLFIVLSCDEKLKNKVDSAIFSITSRNKMHSVKKAKCFEDWLILSLVDDKSAVKLTQLSDKTIEFSTQTKFDVCRINPLNEYYANARFSDTAAADERITEEILSAISYPKADNSSVYLKLSATELKGDSDIGLKAPAFTDKHNIGTQKGNAIHKFMQFCNFAFDDISMQLENLTKAGYLSNEQAELIDINVIRAFFDSDIAKLLKSAGFIKREYEYLVSIKDIPPDSELFNDIIPSEYKCCDTMLQGVIDCLFETQDGKIILLDYKSDRTSIDEIERRYKAQLKVYAHCVEIFMKKKVEGAYIWSFENNRLIQIPI